MASQSTRRVLYYHEERIGQYASIDASLRKPHVVRVADSLIKAYGLYPHVTRCICGQHWSPIAENEVGKFHTEAYLQFLQKLEYDAHEVADQAASFVLNSSVCFSENAWQYSQIYAGGSVAAAHALSKGQADVSINWIGGQPHARRNCASGFSYINDVVLAILALLQANERVLFVNLDAYHANGVEEAFYTTDRVLCLSLHRAVEGFFPGSGGVKDTGEGQGAHHNINLPVKDGFSDDDLDGLFLPTLEVAAENFQPHAVVCCAGSSVLGGDRLGCMNMTLKGYSRCLRALLVVGRPLLLLGGTSYTQANSARVWTALTALACEVDLPIEIPDHEYSSYYSPTDRLEVTPATMSNLNTSESLKATLDAALATVAAMPVRVAVPKLSPPATAAATTSGAALPTVETPLVSVKQETPAVEAQHALSETSEPPQSQQMPMPTSLPTVSSPPPQQQQQLSAGVGTAAPQPQQLPAAGEAGEQADEVSCVAGAGASSASDALRTTASQQAGDASRCAAEEGELAGATPSPMIIDSCGGAAAGTPPADSAMEAPH
uniref:Histone deacetylase 8 n=1 Tax=Coccolithus braarudii TaxID=221442 RepID=A0A7S0Q7E1_9EUKA